MERKPIAPARADTRRRIILRRAFFRLLPLLALAACSVLPAVNRTPQAVVPPPGDFLTTSGNSTATPAEGYPAPNAAASAATAQPKAATPGPASYPMFLPAILNEKTPSYPFQLQSTGVLAIQGFYGCDWAGVAGQIFDLQGAPLQNLVLHLEGIWAGQGIVQEVLSGSAPTYGPAGYEFVLGDQTLDSVQALWIQVRDANNKEISPRINFDTYNDCARNLILVNFNQVN